MNIVYNAYVMKIGLAKRLPLLLISAFMLANGGTALADTTNQPYLKTFGADLMTGGWFNSGRTNCSTVPYQNPGYKTGGFAGDQHTGGILTYTKSAGNASGGASSQYGALSLGQIDGDAGSGNGFYSSGITPGGPVKALTFANTDPALAFGGAFEGSTNQGNCIPDYFSKVDPTNSKVQPLQANWRPLFNPGGSTGGTYYGTAPVTGNSLDIFSGSGAGDMNLQPDKHIAIFVKGNVYISRNITYDSSATVDKVPKFELVVKGSIYVAPSVSRLDGIYIAQPADDTVASVGSDTGIFWSCHAQDAAAPDVYFPPTCPQRLVVNGALVAKQVKLLRVQGDVGSSNTNEDKTTSGNCGYAVLNGTAASDPSCANISEIINYIPAMIMGGSFLNTSTDFTSSVLPIDNVVSLPPVF
jgi:hypothetical protein